jgi:hypothetical protein
MISSPRPAPYGPRMTRRLAKQMQKRSRPKPRDIIVRTLGKKRDSHAKSR